MGWLNHFFMGKKGIAREVISKDKRIASWEKLLSNHPKREELCNHFSGRNINNALRDFDATLRVLGEIEALIPPDLIDIDQEEKLEKDVLKDLELLRDSVGIRDLSETIAEEKRRKDLLVQLFREIHDVLKAELHLIRLIRERPPNVKNLLSHLFVLIFNKEHMLYELFRKELYDEDALHLHEEIWQLAKAIILQEEIKEEEETDEEKFAREMLAEMGDAESRHEYRKLGEGIFCKLAEMAGAPLKMGEDITEGIRKMEGLMKNDAILYKIIKRLKRKYNDTIIRATMLAFRKAYDLNHFEDLESEFAT